MKRVTLFILLVACAVSLCASEKCPTVSDSSLQIPEPLIDYYINNTTTEKLSYCIDLWYDAALKGDTKKVDYFEKSMLLYLKADLDSSRALLVLYSKQLEDFQKAIIMPDSSPKTDSAIFLELLESQALLAQERNTCEKKEKLFMEFSGTQTISNKYRLMSDYIDVLRKQLGMPKLRFANQNAKVSVPIEGKAKAKN